MLTHYLQPRKGSARTSCASVTWTSTSARSKWHPSNVTLTIMFLYFDIHGVSWLVHQKRLGQCLLRTKQEIPSQDCSWGPLWQKVRCSWALRRWSVCPPPLSSKEGWWIAWNVSRFARLILSCFGSSLARLILLYIIIDISSPAMGCENWYVRVS